MFLYLIFVFFFFQAEDGIRDRNVTGVQTCALPILNPIIRSPSYRPMTLAALLSEPIALAQAFVAAPHPGMKPHELGSSLRPLDVEGRDRKSTRLNSSHVSISYAVFCLKKKKKKNSL